MIDIALREEDFVFYVHPTGHTLYRRDRNHYDQLVEYPIFNNLGVATWSFSEGSASVKGRDRYEVEKPSDEFWNVVGLIREAVNSQDDTEKAYWLREVRDQTSALNYREADTTDKLFGSCRNMETDPTEVKEIRLLFEEAPGRENLETTLETDVIQ